MEPIVEDIGTMKVVGVKGKCNMATTMADIPPLWKKLMENSDSIKNKVGECTFGVYTMIDKENCWALASYQVSEVDDVPDGMVSEVVPAMKVAKFTHKGREQELKNTYEKIMGEWLPATGLELDWTKPTLEMYDERFKEGSDESECEIWMAIK